MAKNQTSNDRVWLGLAATRIALGFIFLWAFIDKLWGLKYATPAAKAWVNGGSPTTGFLKGAGGPFAGFFHSLAGTPIADWLFMLGLLGIGVSLILGIGIRIAAWAGAAMMTLMYFAVWPNTAAKSNNPLVDDHVIYALILLTIGWAQPNQKLSIAGWWGSLDIVKKNPWLK
jgi:thiosulfate dehydrogenase [quinone] large subunit